MNRKRFGLRTRKTKTSKVLEAIQKDQKERLPEQGECCFSRSSCAGSVQSKSSFASSAQSSSRVSTSSASSRRSTAASSSAFRKRGKPAFGAPTGLSQLWEDDINQHNKKRSTSDEFFLDGLLVIAPDREDSIEDLFKNDDRNAADFFLP